MKTLLIIGSDKVSQRALASIPVSFDDLIIVSDMSTSINRVWKLLIKNRISIILLIKMVISELRRYSVPNSITISDKVRSNLDLVKVIDKHSPDRIVLFRAGLIINEKVIERGVPLMNIHCANVPSYGGLGSIQRALNDKAFSQNATLHMVTTTIDQGKIFDLEPYQLDPSKGYFSNENNAYDAGIKLLIRTLLT